MTRVLLTGGSGFIATHILKTLLSRGHSVVTTVRSQQKAQRIRDANPSVSNDKLSFAIVEDVGKEDAFDSVFTSSTFDAVIHTASPFHYHAKDIEKELLQPAIVGTTSILHAIKRHAPSVKRVVITSSFAAVKDASKPASHEYTEKDWNPISRDQALSNNQLGYVGSKTFAEKAAWTFMDEEKPSFTLATVNPPFVFGPLDHHLDGLASVNTSNTFVRDALLGKWKRDGVPDMPPSFFVDVRDVAEVHVRAMESDDAAGQRFVASGGSWDVNDLVDVLREMDGSGSGKGDLLPTERKEGLDGKKGVLNSEKSKRVLGVTYRSFRETVTDTAESILEVKGREKA